MVAVSGAWAHSPVGWWPVGWSNSMALSSGNKRRKVDRGLSFLRPRFHFLLCGSSWWGGWGGGTTAQELALDTPGKKSWRVTPLSWYLSWKWTGLWPVTQNPLGDLIPRHSLDTLRQKRHRWADTLSSLLSTTVPRGMSSTLCLYHKYSD